MTHHPAPFSKGIIEEVAHYLYAVDNSTLNKKIRVLDPYAGTGRVLDMIPIDVKASVTMVEIEPEWASMCELRAKQLREGLEARVICGDSAEVLRTDKRTYTHIITSPDYGNRFTDKYNPTPGRVCRSYGQSLKRELSEGSSAQFKFRNDFPEHSRYREVHRAVMGAAIARLVPGGQLILNVSDFYATLRATAGPERQLVTLWWMNMLYTRGMTLERAIPIRTRRFKQGENRHRVAFESVLVFIKEK